MEGLFYFIFLNCLRSTIDITSIYNCLSMKSGILEKRLILAELEAIYHLYSFDILIL